MAGGGGPEGQQEKKAAAEGYAYEKDPRWADYWSNVLIPQQHAGRPDVQRHFQLKFYQRYIDPELDVEPLSKTSSASQPSQPSQPSASTRQRPVNSGSQARATGSGMPRRPSPASAPSGTLRLDQKSFQFLNNAWVVVMAALAIFPLTPAGLSSRAYRFALLGSVIACAHSLYQQHQRPRTWNMQGLQAWMQSIVPSPDFLSFLFSTIFFSSFVPVRFAVIPVLCRSLEQVATFLRQNFSSTQLFKKYLEQPCVMLLNNMTAVRTMSTNAEIFIGFLLIFLFLTPQRNIVQALIYWQLLKLEYRAPSTSFYHQSTWAKIGSVVNPLIQQYAWFLERPLGYARNWFLN
jgi:hypothetical protein